MNLFRESAEKKLWAGIQSEVIAVIAFLCFLVGNLGTSIAQTDSMWIAGNGNWGDRPNWNNGVPIGAFNAIIGKQAGDVTQNLSGLEIFGLELDGSAANIILENNLVVTDFLQWNDGQIGGTDSLTFVGDGAIANGFLETTFNNFGQIVFFNTDSNFPILDSLTGAQWNNKPGSSVELLQGSRFGNFTSSVEAQFHNEMGASLQIHGNGTSFGWDVVNDGVIEVDNSIVLFLGDYQQTATGHLIINEGTVDFFQQVDLLGKVSGTGAVLNLGPIDFNAQLEPGRDSIGVLQFFGSLRMTPQTVSNFQIGPGLTADQVQNFGGPLQLDGLLNIEALGGATTGTYSLFTYNNNFMLRFDRLRLGSVPRGFEGFLFHDPVSGSIKLEVLALGSLLLGDVNLDGVVSLLDVSPFVARIVSGKFQEEADINQDGSVDLLDVQPFIALLAN